MCLNPAVVGKATTATSAITMLPALRAIGQHSFWPDESEVSELPRVSNQMQGLRRIPDVQLALIAERRGGRIAPWMGGCSQGSERRQFTLADEGRAMHPATPGTPTPSRSELNPAIRTCAPPPRPPTTSSSFPNSGRVVSEGSNVAARRGHRGEAQAGLVRRSTRHECLPWRPLQDDTGRLPTGSRSRASRSAVRHPAATGCEARHLPSSHTANPP